MYRHRLAEKIRIRIIILWLIIAKIIGIRLIGEMSRSYKYWEQSSQTSFERKFFLLKLKKNAVNTKNLAIFIFLFLTKFSYLLWKEKSQYLRLVADSLLVVWRRLDWVIVFSVFWVGYMFWCIYFNLSKCLWSKESP